MSRNLLIWARVAGGAVILAVLVWRLGSGPFLDGVRAVSGWSLAVAAAIAVLTTLCSAWRWSVVARGLGVGVPLGAAVAAYYRSQFLNTTLPGGVVGDVQRALRHGHAVGDVGRGLRAVGWERSAGQVVQIALTIIVLLTLPSPVHSSMPLVATAVVAGALGVVLLGLAMLRGGPSRWARSLRVAATDIRAGLLARRAWPGIVLASAVVVAGHVATFVLAARVSGSTASIVQLLPLALIVLLAMGLPTSIGGWGPREGVAAWAFGATGLGAAAGVATAVVYGVMVLVVSLPGAVLLLAGWLPGVAGRPQRAATSERRMPPCVRQNGGARG